jgi:hypothetical protein
MRFTSNYQLVTLHALAVATALVVATPAYAGPPLICHPVDIGSTASLPWGSGSGWDATVSSYDRGRLTADTLRLLTPDASVPVRRETLRRATIYAARDPQVASALLAALVGRVLNGEASGRPDALAWFDAGYLVETYRQASLVYRWNMLSGADRSTWSIKEAPQGLDGYAWVQRAVALSGQQAAMVQAASLIRAENDRVAQASR